MFLTFGNVTRSCRIIQTSRKCIFEWSIEPKSRVFGHFQEFLLLDRLSTAYCDSSICFLTFGNVTRSWRIIQTSQKCSFEWSERPKVRFLAIFRSLACWIDLILHIVIVLNVLRHMARLLLFNLEGLNGSKIVSLC